MQHPNHYTLRPQQIVLYTSAQCGDCRMAKAVFEQQRVAYLEVSVEQDRKAQRFLRRLNHGFASVPTIVFPDGSVLVEPSVFELAAKFSES